RLVATAGEIDIRVAAIERVVGTEGVGDAHIRRKLVGVFVIVDRWRKSLTIHADIDLLIRAIVAEATTDKQRQVLGGVKTEGTVNARLDDLEVGIHSSKDVARRQIWRGVECRVECEWIDHGSGGGVGNQLSRWRNLVL